MRHPARSIRDRRRLAMPFRRILAAALFVLLAGSLDMRLSSWALPSENHVQRALFLGSSPVHDERPLPLTIVAGSPVTILYYLHGQRDVGGEHGSEATGQVTFEGLPAGTTVVSCQGCLSSATTPVLRTSWGRLKAHYR